MSDDRPLVMHLVYSFHVGGLENGVVNLVNRMPHDRFRHAIVALATLSPTFCDRITRPDVEFIELRKSPGHGVKLYPRLVRLFREHAPAIVHTRNLAALEAVVPAWYAGVPVRIHGEHGWDVSDPEGRSRKYRAIRRLYKPFVNRYVALSGHLADYLRRGVGISADRIEKICNGVDTERFRPSPTGGRELLEGSPFNATRFYVIGTVGRLQAVKDQLNLVRAFALLLQQVPNDSRNLRLMIVGDGPMRAEVEAEVRAHAIERQVWIAGERGDIPAVLRAMDLFVLPSRAEGISNTILEAMATGLPVIATRVGGNGELVEHGQTGALVKPMNSEALASVLRAYVARPDGARDHGRNARARAETLFSLDAMVRRYVGLYDSCLKQAGVAAPVSGDLSSADRPN